MHCDQLIEEHAGIARSIALKLGRRCPSWVTREDLVAAGMLGLTEAARRYDTSRTEPFLSFAAQRIRGAVLDELRRGDLMSRRARQASRKVKTVVRALEAAGAQLTDDAIASELGVSVEHYRDELAPLLQFDLQSVEGERAAPLIDPQQSPEELVEYRQLVARVHAALARLPERDAQILSLHYIEELTYEQIAEVLGVSGSRVCQLLWRAVEKLRAQLA